MKNATGERLVADTDEQRNTITGDGQSTVPRPRGDTAPAFLATARELVTAAMRQASLRIAPAVRHVTDYHHGWIDQHGVPVGKSTGKALRPALALLSARAVGAGPERAIAAAVAVEFVHSFSLLHDDVMDGDVVRRHRPTAWVLFGRDHAILAGDALLTASVSVLLDAGEPGAADAAASLLNASQRLVVGQAADLGFERRDEVSLDECVRMARDKTSALLSCAASIGARIVDGDQETVDHLAEFGEHLGLAFQLTDDLLGIWGDPSQTGKPVLADLRARKKSLPVVAALTGRGPAADELAELYLGTATLDDHDLVRVAQLVRDAGGEEWARREADLQLRSALRCLRQVDAPRAVRTDLAQIAMFAVSRHW